MAIKSSSIDTGATLGVSGGTPITLGSLGTSGGTTVSPTVDVDYATRRTFKFTATDPTPNTGSPDGYTKVRKAIVCKFPLTLASGEVTIDTFRIEHAHSIEADSTEIVSRLKLVAQLLFDNDFNSFHTIGSLE